MVTEDRKIRFIDENGDYVGSEYDYYDYDGHGGPVFRDDGYAVVTVNGKFGVIDKSGSYVISPVFDAIEYYS